MIRKFTLLSALTASLFLATSPLALAGETPRRGGTINFVAPYGDSFPTLDIHSTPEVQAEFYAKAIHRALYAWDGVANKPYLDLATDVAVSDDKLVYTYKLRKDAIFHNGKPMTADDIIWSYTRVMDPKITRTGSIYVEAIKGARDYAAGKATSISGLKKIDDHTIEITFAEPVDPSYKLLYAQTSIYPAGMGDSDEFIKHPIGLGPYKFEEYVPGSRLSVTRWDKFYKPGKPYADRINIMIMSDASARDIAFRNAEIDLTVLGSAQYAAYKADPVLSSRLLEAAEAYTRFVALIPNSEPFKDKRVRQAVNYAIDSDLIIKRLLKGKAYRAASFLPTSSAAFDKNAKPYPYDLEKAKQLLAEAGYAKGFEIEITATQNESWGLPVVEAITPMLAKAGIKVKAKPVESSVLSQVATSGNSDAFMWSVESGPDALTRLNCFHSATKPAGCNYYKFNNPEFDKLYEAARLAKTDDERTQLLRQANNLLQEEAPMWFFNYNKAVVAYHPWLHGLQPNSNELAIQAYEDLWLDEASPRSK